MQYVSGWLPGAGFQDVGRKRKEYQEAYVNKPFQPVFDAMVNTFVCKIRYGANISPFRPMVLLLDHLLLPEYLRKREGLMPVMKMWSW